MLKNNRSFLYKLKTGSFWYLIGGIFTNGLSILLMPYLTEMLTPAEYGVIQTANSIVLFLPFLFGFYIDSGYARFYHDVKEDLKEIEKMFSTCIWFTVLAGFGILILFCLSSFFWFESVFERGPYPLILVIAVPSLLNQIINLNRIHLVQELKVKKIAAIDFLSALVNLSLSIYLVYLWDDGAFARLFSIGVAAVTKLFFYILYIYKLRILSFKFDIYYLKLLLKFSIPLIPSGVSLWLSKMADRLIISFYIGISATGIFSAANQIAMITYFIQDAAMQALGPIQMDDFVRNKERAIKNTQKTSELMWIIMGGVVLFFGLFGNTIMKIFINERFTTSSLLIMILSGTYMIQAQYRIFSGVLMFYKRTREYSIAAILQAVVSISLNLLLIPQYGYVAAAYTSLISIFVFWFGTLFFVNKIEEVKYNWNIYIKSLILILFIMLISLLIKKYTTSDFLLNLFNMVLFFIYALANFRKIKSLFNYLKE